MIEGFQSIQKEFSMTKILLLTTFSIFSIYVGAKTQVYECKALIRENKVVETFRFQFKCDNYGQGATFQSQSKRFTLMAFSEESCTPNCLFTMLR